MRRIEYLYIYLICALLCSLLLVWMDRKKTGLMLKEIFAVTLFSLGWPVTILIGIIVSIEENIDKTVIQPYSEVKRKKEQRIRERTGYDA